MNTIPNLCLEIGQCDSRFVLFKWRTDCTAKWRLCADLGTLWRQFTYNQEFDRMSGHNAVERMNYISRTVMVGNG
jgi:hypothetical protein